MKKFILLVLIASAGLTATYLLSCKDTDSTKVVPTSTPTTVNDQAAGDRGPCPDCFVSIHADANSTLELCGDLSAYSTSCTGCTAGAVGATVGFTANVEQIFCVPNSAKICIRNTGNSRVTVYVSFGSGSAPILSEALDPNEQHCWHTTGDCDDTIDGC